VALRTSDPARAAAVLREGGICVYPTETFYGLGALVTRPEAIARLGAAKLRPEGKPLPLVAADTAGAFALWARVPPEAVRLADRFWPGPLTLAAPAAAGIHRDVAAGGTVEAAAGSRMVVFIGWFGWIRGHRGMPESGAQEKSVHLNKF
jgi:L-threonylcarbamoyladenylate synthase